MGLYPYDVCDFCSDAPPMWRYPCATFPSELGKSLGDWLACDECRVLIERGEWTKLARRSLRAPGVAAAVRSMGEDRTLAMIGRLHRGFQAHRAGAALRERKAS